MAKVSGDTISEISDFIVTKDDADRLLQAVRVVEESVWRGSDMSSVVDTVSEDESEIVGEALRSLFRDCDDRENFKNRIALVREYLGKKKIVRLELAIEPTRELIVKIADLVRVNGRRDFLLDSAYDRSIGAGARIIYGGKYFERVLDDMIKEAFESEKFVT